MQNDSILIIGAGAAGLMAARILAQAGLQVTVLEARDRIGGRIHTVHDLPFSPFADLGAEFIHGKLPVTLGLLKEAGLKHTKAAGEMWQAKDGKLFRDEHFIAHWDVFMKRLEELKTDMSVDAFLDTYLSEEKYAALRASARRYAEGYDTADTSRASMMALKEEWLHEDDPETTRPKDGYSALMQFLADECIKAGGRIQLSSAVQQIQWSENKVAATTGDGSIYTASKVLLTIPVGVWQANDVSKGTVQFFPALDDHMAAFRKMGMGAIIKIMLQFRTPIWKTKEIKERTGADMDDMLFIFSDQQIPTWWSQHPADSGLLTGWLGGPKAATLAGATEDEILAMALKSLAGIFDTATETIAAQLGAWHIANWTNIPFTCGSYAYVTTETEEALQLLSIPVKDTIWFSGEAIYKGASIGTVEAALVSGKEAAEKILAV